MTDEQKEWFRSFMNRNAGSVPVVKAMLAMVGKKKIPDLDPEQLETFTIALIEWEKTR